ncbi:MAG: hypothetical protein GF418_01090 [Chitinivibrionales bacterium]|nr:hypothetical protein [Chitinivibrionales bacterium]MBD3394197.1 hypothetical protein [Chitinivibrionales bacterium]
MKNPSDGKSCRKVFLIAAIALALVLGSCYQPTQFEPPEDPVTLASAGAVGSFVGGGTVKLAYTRKKGGTRWVYFVDFTLPDPEPVLLKKPSGKDNINADSPIISPDGGFVAYALLQGNTSHGAYIQALDENAEPVLVDASGVEPHWWQDSNGDLYVIFSDVFLVTTGQLASVDGKTYKAKVTLSGASATVQSSSELAPYPMNGGLSSSGRYLATGYGDAAFYDLQSDQLTLINEGLQVCNPSISPDPDNENRMLFLNFQGVQNLDGSFVSDPSYPKTNAEGRIEQHDVVFIVDNTNTVQDFIPVMSPYAQLQDPEWTNNSNLVSALGVIDVETADAILIDLTTKEIVKVAEGLNITSTPYVWDGNQGTGSSQSSLTVVEPDSGDAFSVGDTVTIEWQVNDSNIKTVGVALFLEGGTQVDADFLDHGIAVVDSTSYNWVVAGDQVSNECYIKVYDFINPSSYALSGEFATQN